MSHRVARGRRGGVGTQGPPAWGTTRRSSGYINRRSLINYKFHTALYSKNSQEQWLAFSWGHSNENDYETSPITLFKLSSGNKTLSTEGRRHSWEKVLTCIFETCVLRYFSATLIMLPTSAAVISGGCSPGVWPGGVQPLRKPGAIPLGLPFLTLRTNWGFLRKWSSVTRGLSLQWWFSFPAGEEDGWFIMGVYFKTTSKHFSRHKCGILCSVNTTKLGVWSVWSFPKWQGPVFSSLQW